MSKQTILVSSLYLLLHIVITKSFAQSKSIGTVVAGNSAKINSIVVDWNLGQVFSKSLSDQNKLLLTTGLMQPKDFEKISNPTLDSLVLLDNRYNLISLYPNPTNDHLFIINSQFMINIVEMSMLSMKGELLRFFYPPFSTPIFKKRIDLSGIVSGTYLMRINYILDNRYYRTKYYKFIKM